MDIKRFAIAATLQVAAIITTIAQSTPFVDHTRPDKFIEVGLHVGDGVSSVLQNYGKEVPGLAEFNFTPGNMNSFGVSVVMPIRNYLGIGTGIDAAIYNNHWSMTVLDAEASTLNNLYTRNHYYALEVPMFLALNFNLGQKVLWTNEIGAYMSFGLGNGSSKTKAFASSTNSLGQSQVTEISYNRKYYKDDEPIINGVTTTDYGLHLATGLRFYKHFSLKAVFHVGARNLAINYGVLDIKNHNLTLAFKAGYIF